MEIVRVSDASVGNRLENEWGDKVDDSLGKVLLANDDEVAQIQNGGWIVVVLGRTPESLDVHRRTIMDLIERGNRG